MKYRWERVNSRPLSILLILTMFSVLVLTAPVEPVSARLFHDKPTMTKMWKDLCDTHRSRASYESIGKSIQGKDIWLFKIGNPHGGAIMWDGQVHGPEDAGSECGYLFAKWLLESSDSQAERILDRNYWLFIPVVNVDNTGRQNMRRSYVLTDGTVVNAPYGVDLNRNGVTGFGHSGSGDPNDAYDYRGLYGGSEPEMQALRHAMDKYRPKVYVNTHNGGEYLMYQGPTTAMENWIIYLYNSYASASGVPKYSSIWGSSVGGFVISDAHSFGASAWLWEIIKWENISDYQTLVAQWYPRVKPMMLAMSEAAGVDGVARNAGDINVDGAVDLFDVLLLVKALGSTTGDPNWNPEADLNLDSVIDVYDAVILAGHYGEQFR